MRSTVRIFLVAGLVAPCVACDQATKALAMRVLDGRAPVELLDGVLRFQLAVNPGAFLSLGAQLPELARQVIFFALVPLALLWVTVALLRGAANSASALIGISLILGGGLGNWLDRILNDGFVIDFVSLGFGGLRTGIFNVADVAILSGVALVAFRLRERPPEDGGEGNDAAVSSPRPPPESPSR